MSQNLFDTFGAPPAPQNQPQPAPQHGYAPPSQAQYPGFGAAAAPQPGFSAPQAPAQGFTTPSAPAQPMPPHFGGPGTHQGPGFTAHPPPAQAQGPGFGAAPAQHAPVSYGYDPLGRYEPEVGFSYLRFPDEAALHLVQIDGLRIHDSDKGMRQVVETTLVASTSRLLTPGQKPSTTIAMQGTFANKERTDLLAACAGYHKVRDKDRIVAEVNAAVLRAANFTPGAQPTEREPFAVYQGPGCFAGRYVLVETVRKPKKGDSAIIYTNFFFHAVPQPAPGQSYTPEQVQVILARQYDAHLPVPPPVA
jgi:hypothetical protein